MTNNLLWSEARERSAVIGAAEYEVRLSLGLDAESFASATTVRFTADPSTETFIEFAARRIDRIQLNGLEIDPNVATSGDRITLGQLQRHNVLEVVGECSFSRTAEGLHRFVDPEDGETYLYSHFEPYEAHRVFACFDQPDIKARWTLRVDCPTAWTVVSNTDAASVSDCANGRRLWEFDRSPSLSTYVFAIAAGPYHGVHSQDSGTPLGLYCRRTLAPYLDAEELLILTRRGLRLFEAEFGIPYAFGKYDQIFVPELNAGAMENAACVTIADTSLFRSPVPRARHLLRATVVLHELAHMWFGNLVTMRWWNDLWLNESFATYAAFRALSETHDPAEAWSMFCDTAKVGAMEQDQLPTTHPVVTDAPDIETAKSNFDEITYSKGSAVLRQLASWVGPEAFREALHDYFVRYRWGNTEMGDLLRGLQDSSGRNVSSWAERWLRRPGVNTLRANIDTAESTYTEFSVLQDGEPPRPHRIGIGLYYQHEGALNRAHHFVVDIDGPTTDLPELIGIAEADLVLINDDDLTYARICLDDKSRRSFAADPAALADPLARSLCWAATWQATYAAEMPSDEFLDMVCRGVAAETDTAVIQRLLGYARTAAVFLGADDQRGGRLATLAAEALRMASAAEAGSDRQLVFVYALVATSTDANLLRDLVAGMPGLPPVGSWPELRWAVVERLAVLGEADEGFLDAELKLDGSAEARLQHATALAALPDPARKAVAWKALTGDAGLSNHELLAIATGFAQPEQGELLRGYTATYFATLATLWTERLEQSVTPLLVLPALYPTWDISTAALEAASRALEQTLPDPIRRIVIEKRDFVAHAIKCRAVGATQLSRPR